MHNPTSHDTVEITCTGKDWSVSSEDVERGRRGKRCVTSNT